MVFNSSKRINLLVKGMSCHLDTAEPHQRKSKNSTKRVSTKTCTEQLKTEEVLDYLTVHKEDKTAGQSVSDSCSYQSSIEAYNTTTQPKLLDTDRSLNYNMKEASSKPELVRIRTRPATRSKSKLESQRSLHHQSRSPQLD